MKIPPPGREGTGGAVTSWGKYVVLITHEGRIYFIGPDSNAVLSKIKAPFNGFDDYVAAAAEPPFHDVSHEFYNYRYNDISYFKVSGRQGLLVSYTKYDKSKACFTTTVSRLYVDDAADDIVNYEAAADRWVDIFQTSPCLPLKRTWRALEGHMAGGRMVFDGTKNVILASGEYHWDGIYGPRTIPGTDPDTGPAVAQDPKADYGKVIAIDVETGKAHQMARGVRNTQGITRDDRGRIWTVEHGVRGGDELNLIVEGGNYGWPLESYGTLYSGLPLPTLSLGRHEHFRKPSIAWLPSLGISGLTQVEGFHEAWNGDLLASTLGSGQLLRIRIDGDRVVFTEFIDIGHRIRHVHQHGDGRIVLWTDEHEIIFLSPALGGLGFNYVNERLNKMEDRKDLAGKVRSKIQDCMECHSLNAEDNAKAPSLGKVFGSRVGSTSFARYSEALKSDERTWTGELLRAYLADPQAAMPGTIMPDPHISDAEVRDEIVKILEELATSLE